MRRLNLKIFTNYHRLTKLTCLVGIFSISSSIASLTIAQPQYPPYALFQPLAYSGYPYRDANTSNIADTLAKETKFKNLVAELKEAGLLEELKQKGNFTILAPTDEAFEALPEDVFDRFENKQDLVKVLKYHLIPSQVTPEQVKSGTITTSVGDRIKVTVNPTGAIALNDANAKQPFGQKLAVENYY